MNFKIITIAAVLVTQGLGAALPAKDEPWLARNSSKLRYHSNMTSMWMVDDFGNMREVYLTAPPPHHKKPVGNVEDNVFYYLYTREYNSAYQLIKNDEARLNSSTFNPNRPTKVVTHGFMSSCWSDSVQLIRESYLNSQNVNIVGVEWSKLAAGPWYSQAVSYTEPVGQEIAQMIDFLVSNGANITDIHLIGHSLGAHVMSFASNHITSGRIKRITGCDAALPLFKYQPPDKRLDPTDADVVDCIHSCGGYLGFYNPLCSHDFYPNGGTFSQPGCHWDFTGACSHGRSYRYYSAAISTQFPAVSCDTFDDVKHERCNGAETGIMGDLAPATPPGMYYLKTSENYPYKDS